MSELTARLAIYGSIDDAVTEGRLSVSDAARYLRPYAAGPTDAVAAAGWYTAMIEVIGSGGGSTSLVLPPADPDAAIAELAERSLEHPIDAEHRLRALFLAARLLDEVDTSPDSHFVSAVRAVVEFGRGPDEEIEDTAGAALRLTQLLVGESDQHPVDTTYVAMAVRAQQEHVVSAMTAELASATCDEGTTWYDVPGTTDVDVAAVVTSRVVVSVAERSVSDLRLRFHPGRWPDCLPTFWGAMVPLAPPWPKPSPSVDPGTSLFICREQVGDQSNRSQWFNPVLEFWYDELTAGPPDARVVDGFAIHYGMARSLPPGEAQDPHILVDDGEMSVRRSNVAGGSMTVTARTYKKLAMRPPLPSAGLAIFACASGWADQAKALITGCLVAP